MSDGFEWLDWLEPSGPFVAAPVLKKAFPQGLDTLDSNKRRTLRQAYDEYRQALDDEDAEASKFHEAWIDLVLKQGLEYDEDESGDNLKAADELSDSLASQVAEHGVTLKPDYAVVDDQNADKSMMLIQVYDWDVNLNDAIRGDGWASSPRERMVRLCRDTGTRLGLITNGEHWLFVDAPVGAISSFASWYARLWGPEPVLLQALVALLGIRRLFVAEDEQLPALIDKSVEYQDEVTEALGEQVRRAVEVLIQALDKADLDRNRELLKDVKPRELYEAGLTVMMRLVFLLSAEERELLLLGDERYEANYAVSTLRMQLRGEDDAILQRRWDAWSRLLAIFRAIYGGIEHEALRMPALGGSLFDPDRFPFLEGREKDSSWKADPANPLPIDNQTVLLLLDAIQLFEGRTLSYRGLDIEQLGYVYEGLLDHTVKRAKEVTLELDATKNAKQPWVTLGELESARLDGENAVEKLLKERTGSSISRVRNDLKKKVKPQQSVSLLTACHNDQALHDQLKKYFHLTRTDSWGRPLVYPEGSFMVTTGEDRRQTGSHYTPTSLTEAIVRETLEPVVYVGPAEGKPREEWHLKSPEQLLDLKICDPAMGSGAFLVQVCRWLGDRVVESWTQSEDDGGTITVDGSATSEVEGMEPMTRDPEGRAVMARRLIAERCIYGVDLNPLAVELAKLSVWLVTLAKGRPFGFLDHNLKCGDSLLGIRNVDQLKYLDMKVGKGTAKKLFASRIDTTLQECLVLRGDLRSRPMRDIQDIEIMGDLDQRARAKLELLSLIADALVGEALSAGAAAIDTIALSIEAGVAMESDGKRVEVLSERAVKGLGTDLPVGKPLRRPFHWPLEFPEVFCRENGGFDSFVGNPPFAGGKKTTGLLGTAYRQYLVAFIANGMKGSADLVVYFFLHMYQMLRKSGAFGLLAVNTIAEGEGRQVGLERLVREGAVIYIAFPNQPWPGKASVAISRVHIFKGEWKGDSILSDRTVPYISPYLSDQEEWSPKKLVENSNKSFKGCNVLGLGFTLTENEAAELLNTDESYSEIIFPYLNGKDVNSHPRQFASRWIINFWDWPEERARRYSKAFRIVEKKVKPERQRRKPNGDFKLRKPLPQKWWHYNEKSPALYHAIGYGEHFVSHPPRWDPKSQMKDRVLVKVITSKHHAFCFVPNEYVIDQTNIVIDTDDYLDFSILQSTIHQAWAAKQGSSLESRPRYNPSNCYETFPFPSINKETADALRTIGKRYHAKRANYLTSSGIGLTKFYNIFHDPGSGDKLIKNLRLLHAEMDQAVLRAFDWGDIENRIDFYEVSYLPENDRIRFTLSERIRIEVIQRLTQLNRRRYEKYGKRAPGSISGVVPKPSNGGETSTGDLFHGAPPRTTEA